MFRQRTDAPARASVIALLLASTLAGCSGLYTQRSDTIAQSAGDAIAANKMQQMYDPWPVHSGNTNYAANGQKMQSAIERYRTNRVTPPINPTTSDVENHQDQAALAAQNNNQPASGANMPLPTTSPGNATGQ